MRNLRLISTAAAILLLGAGAVSAQSIKTDETPARAPAAQQNAPAEKMAPALKSDQSKAPETTGQAAPTAPESAPAGAATKSGAASPSGKSADEGKRSTTGQGTANEGMVAGPRHGHYRHYRYHRNCWTDLFGYRHCWY